MDPTLLTDPWFWEDPAPRLAGGGAGEAPELPGLEGHVLFETSGSSGRPKWVALSKQALLISAAVVNRHLEADEDSCWGLALPLRHVGGFGVVARAFEAAARLVAFRGRWEPVAFTEWLAKRGVSHSSLVPTQVHDLVAAGQRAPAGLRAVVVGGGQLPQRAGQAARDLGWPLLASYGMSETASQVATQPLSALDQPYRPAPLPLLPIWRAETREDERLWLDGPALFSGLVERDASGRPFFVPRAEAGFLTNDRVALAGGFLSPLGRADLRVKVLGELVDPEAVERDLEDLRGADGAAAGALAVVPLADARAGHRLLAVFEAAADREAVAALLARHHARAPGFLRLEGPRFVDSLPRSPLGKLRRGELARLVAG